MMPFPGGIAGTANGTLLLSVAAAVLYLAMVAQPASLRRTAVKTAGVALLALLSLLEGGPWLLVAALALGALGDAFLANEGERAFLSGLASFLAAHVAYVMLFAGAGDVGLVTGEWPRLGAAVALVAFGGAMFVRLRPALPQRMVVPVGAYVVTIIAMGLTALALPAPLVIAGAVLFIVSDAILSAQMFLLAPGSPHLAWTRPAVWIAYYCGQAAITLGVLLA